MKVWVPISFFPPLVVDLLLLPKSGIVEVYEEEEEVFFVADDDDPFCNGKPPKVGISPQKKV